MPPKLEEEMSNLQGLRHHVHLHDRLVTTQVWCKPQVKRTFWLQKALFPSIQPLLCCLTASLHSERQILGGAMAFQAWPRQSESQCQTTAYLCGSHKFFCEGRRCLSLMAFLFLFLFRKLSSFPLLFSSAYFSASSNFRFSAVEGRRARF